MLEFIKIVGLSLMSFFFVKKPVDSCHSTIIQTDKQLSTVNYQLSTKIDFNRQIKPILADRCFKCHGPDKNKVEAGLQLTSFEAATMLLKTGKRAIVPFKPNESELVKRIMSTDPDEIMPNPKANLNLNDAEKKLLIQWIEQGAEYAEHWAFIPPKKYDLPEVENKTWAKNEIDYFILKKLEEHGLKPNNESNKETLIRRLSFDLRGLPPSLEEIHDFVNDKRPNAYELLVDKLLASPHFGERMALDWLDVARYADSHGYQDDGLRNAYPYRDWVIRAFNQNLSYDKFATWQIAGDLLKNPTNDQLIATCFNRSHQQTQEGGVVDEEYRTEYVADRVNTFGKAFLGMTVECARCHTHKYDPITHSEYYSLFAFFNSNKETGIVPYSGEASPTLLLMTDKAQKSLDSLHLLMKPYEAKAKVSDQYKAGLEKWLAKSGELRVERNAGSSPISTPHSPLSTLHSERGRIVYLDFEPLPDSLIYDDVNPPTVEELAKRAKAIELARLDSTKKISLPQKYKGFLNKDTSSLTRAAILVGDKDRYPKTVEGKFGHGVRFMGESGIQLGRALDFEKNQPFTISIWIKLLKESEESFLFGKTNGEFEGHRGYFCRLNKDGTLSFRINHAYPANGIDIQTIDKFPLNEWTQLTLRYDGSSQAKGTDIFINGKASTTKIISDHLERSILHSAKPNYENWSYTPFQMGTEMRESLQNVEMDELQIWKRQLSSLEIQQLAENKERIESLITKAKCTEEENKQVLEYYLLSGNNSVFNESLDSLSGLRFKETQIKTGLEEVMIMEELVQPRKSYRLNRGAYDAQSEEVFPTTPAKLLPFDTLKYPKNRLGLAQWLMDEKNPLFARVAVNRYWQMLFGKGIVQTQEDFGNQGAFPTHPELLDWLAINFRNNNWDVKGFLKKVVMSATYRQSSNSLQQSAISGQPSQESSLLVAQSSELYGHYPVHRLSAELVRDNALASSGLLVTQIGGRSVFPYQPAGIWEALATRNASTYVQNHGDSLYRRSLYTIWKRSSPPPSMMNFDATDRSVCIARRQKTSSPLQALVLMNDPQFVEAARVLACRAAVLGGSIDTIEASKHGISTNAVLEFIFQSLTSRRPRESELEVLKNLFEKELAYFKQNPEKSLQLLSVGEFKRNENLDASELAALTIVASTIMNFDEFTMLR